MLVLDTEDDGKANVTIINFFDGVKHYTFTGEDKQVNAWNWLCKQPKQICWAVNAEYDLINLFGVEWIGKLVTLQYVSSGLMRAFYKEGPITFLDTYRHWALSVEKMGEQLGFPKLKMPHYGCDCMKCIEYCQRDCEIPFRFASEMLNRYEFLGLKIKATLPAMAMQLFKKFYRKEFPELPKGIISLFRDAYYGGRVEMYRKGHVVGPILHYDVNSLFPSVMLGNDYPKLDSWYKTTKPDYSREGVVRGFVNVPQDFIPCLPVRNDHEIFYPYGTFEGSWTYPEVRYLLQNGGTIIPSDAVEFAEIERPFDEYVNFCYSERLRSTAEVDRTFWKLFLNSLYGKFGQSRGITTVYFDKNKREVCEREISSVARTSNVIWSAYVTSYARIRLRSYLKRCHEIFYTDTDSVFTREDLPVSTDLGALKLEGNYKNCEFVGNKIYATEDKAKAKGVRKDMAADFIRTGRAIFRKPARYREAMRNHVKANYWYETEKTFNAEYTKRIVNKDGSTEPWEYNRYKLFLKNGR
jgi:DNA polymerase type B, organellar and viral